MRHVRVQAKRLRRKLRRLDSRARWRAKPWWHRWSLERLVLEDGMADAYPGFVAWQVGEALVYHGTVSLSPLPIARRVTLVFPGRPSGTSPIVMTDGPTSSRHRFRSARPTSLCLWYPGDPEQLRWTLKDGLVALVDLSRLHLIKEVWWRVHSEWPGLEVHRDPNLASESARKRDLAKARRRCWCGKGRYIACHGAIPALDELRELQLHGH